MSGVARVAISLDPELLEQFDRASVPLRAADREYLEDREQVVPDAQPLEHARLLAQVAHAGLGQGLHELEAEILRLGDLAEGGSRRLGEREIARLWKDAGL